MAKLLYMGWASKVRLVLQYPLLPHVGVYDLNMCEASQRGWCNRCLGEHFFGTTVYNFFLLVVESLSHSHTIATTSRRPMTTDNYRQPSTTNYRPNFRSTIGRRPVADQSPTNCQSLADRTPSEFRIIIKIWKPIGDWLSQNQRLVGNHSAIGRRPFCIRGTKAWQIYAYQPETSVVSLAVQGIIRIANEESNCILLICNSDHPFDCQARITALFYHGRITNGHSSLP